MGVTATSVGSRLIVLQRPRPYPGRKELTISALCIPLTTQSLSAEPSDLAFREGGGSAKVYFYRLSAFAVQRSVAPKPIDRGKNPLHFPIQYRRVQLVLAYPRKRRAGPLPPAYHKPAPSRNGMKRGGLLYSTRQQCCLDAGEECSRGPRKVTRDTGLLSDSWTGLTWRRRGLNRDNIQPLGRPFTASPGQLPSLFQTL